MARAGVLGKLGPTGPEINDFDRGNSGQDLRTPVRLRTNLLVVICWAMSYDVAFTPITSRPTKLSAIADASRRVGCCQLPDSELP